MLTSARIDRMGDVVSALGLPEFGAQFFELFSDPLAVDQCTVFVFRGARPPELLVVEGKCARTRRIVEEAAREYVAGEFQNDPNLKHSNSLPLLTVRSLRANHISNDVYRRRFYEAPSLAHELVLLGKIQDLLFYSSFYRSDRSAGFGEDEVNLMQQFATFTVKALHKHHEFTHEGALVSETLESRDAPLSRERRQRVLEHLREVLLAEPHMLSPREAEVCAAIILGHTTQGIGLNLGISLNTVATHRKRAYRKLGICSQSELFSRYFQFVNQWQARLPRS